MRNLSARLTVVTSLLAAVAAPSRAAGPAAELLGWVPARANVVLLIDKDALYQSEVAKNNRWGSPDVAMTGLDSLPANIGRLAVASQFGPGTGPAWEVTVVGLKKPISEAEFAKRNDGTRETIAGRPVVLTPRHGYVANLAPGVGGAHQPPNRPDAGRWLREATGKVPAGFSPYLKAAADRVGPAAPVVLAVDTTDMFDPGLVKAKLAASGTFKGKAAEAGAVAGLIAGMKGVTLTVKATDKLTGELKVEFAGPAAPLAAVGKPLLLEALDRMGVKADEMDGWAFAVKGDAVTLAGPLDPDSADQLLAPFLRPSASAVEPDEAAGGGSDAQSKASLRYFRAVQKIMNEVRNSKNDSYPQLAFRYNNGARRIDDLPILNVDDELLDWGAASATTFRAMAVVAQRVGGMISLAEANKSMTMTTTPNYYYGSAYAGGVGYWGAYGAGYGYATPTGAVGTSFQSNYGQIDNMNTMTNQKELEYRLKTWDTIKTATNDVRRKMVKKYGVEF